MLLPSTPALTEYLLPQDWALASLEADHWVKEEPYEMVNFSPAVRSIRLERAANRGQFKSELFKGGTGGLASFTCLTDWVFVFRAWLSLHQPGL